MARILSEAGLIAIVALISPLAADRAPARSIVGDDRFLEIFVNARLETCERRDHAGLSRRARAGEIPDFTG